MRLSKEHTIIWKKASGFAVALGLTTSTFGAGFQLAERSTIGLGRAYSGEAAIADDASIIASNPAGMTLLEGTQVTVGAQYIVPTVEVSARNVATGATAKTNDAAPNAAVPNLYLTHKINDDWSIGFGSFTTYGLKTDYGTDITGVIGSDYSEVFSVNIQPSIAYQVTDQFSVGAGLNIMYVKGEITSDPIIHPAAGPVSPSFDLSGDDLAFGYNVGLLYQLTDSTRVGLHYRSQMDLALEGDAEFGAPLTSFNNNTTLAVSLPDILEFSVYHEINDRWAVHGDVLWTFWSKFEELAPKVDPVVDGNLATPEHWNDAVRISLGTTYKASEKLTLRAGFAWDQSPVDDEFRTFRIPDSERYWLSAGASYHYNDQLTFDAGYTYIISEESKIYVNDVNEETATGDINGNVNIFGLGATYKF